MLLKILTWNINFIYDNWSERIININNTLEQEIKQCDIIALQEATLPFSDTAHTIYKFLEAPIINYFQHRLFSEEENYIYNKIKENFPQNRDRIVRIFEYCMDKLLLICSCVFSVYGELLKSLYFKYPRLCLILVILCPFLSIGSYLFLGMLTIINKNIDSVVKTKFVGRAIQYTEFKYNNKKIIVVNIHLNEGNKKSKRMNEIKKIHKFVETKNKDIIILAGDFNATPSSAVYKFLKQKGYTSCIKEIQKKEQYTFPSTNPKKCIDYIWIKGDNVDIKEAIVFSKPKATDHKGIKVTLDIK